jgi:DNA-binding transcriptional LysR family regulator
MDLLHALETFARVVETGSFAAVARENNISNSAVTRLVGQLEEHFGVRLFHRTTRHLGLTEDGQDLLTHARQLIDAAAGLEDTLGRHRAAPAGRVRVGLTNGGARLLTPGLAELHRRYPGLAIDVVVREHFDDLIGDRLDLAVRVARPVDASLVVRMIGGFGRALVASPSYVEEHGAPATPEDVRGHICIVHDGGPDSGHWRFTGPGGSQVIEVESAFTATTSNVVRQAALAGQGIALLSEPLVHEDINGGRLMRLLPDYPTERSQLYLVYPSRRYLAPRTRVVIDFVVEQFQAVGRRLADEPGGVAEERVWQGQDEGDVRAG